MWHDLTPAARLLGIDRLGEKLAKWLSKGRKPLKEGFHVTKPALSGFRHLRGRFFGGKFKRNPL